jgi:hypothetical protein
MPSGGTRQPRHPYMKDLAMNFESVNNKQLNLIEQLSKDLLAILTKAKLGDEPICKELAALAKDATTERQSRFDEVDTDYKGF